MTMSENIEQIVKSSKKARDGIQECLGREPMTGTRMVLEVAEDSFKQAEKLLVTAYQYEKATESRCPDLEPAVDAESRFEGIVLVEGELSTDGRLINRDAIKFRINIPVVRPGHDGNASEIVGRIDLCYRAGEKIWVRGTMFNSGLEVGSPLCAQLDVGAIIKPDERDQLVVTHAKLAAVFLGTGPSAFPNAVVTRVWHEQVMRAGNTQKDHALEIKAARGSALRDASATVMADPHGDIGFAAWLIVQAEKEEQE